VQEGAEEGLGRVVSLSPPSIAWQSGNPGVSSLHKTNLVKKNARQYVSSLWAGQVEQGKIHIFFGKMGSGKTSNAVHQMLRWHEAGKTVWCNFPVNETAVSTNAPFYREDDPAGILSMRDGLYVIDEAYMTLNAREWANLPKHVFTAFTHVRKLHMTVIVIAQSWMRIDKSIREVTSRARRFEGGSLFGRRYRFVDFEVDELGEIVKPLEEREIIDERAGSSWFGKRVYQSYDTDNLFGESVPPRKWESAVRKSPVISSPPVQSPETLKDIKMQVRGGEAAPHYDLGGSKTWGEPTSFWKLTVSLLQRRFGFRGGGSAERVTGPPPP